MAWQTVNVNQYVRVKLTERGKNILRKEYEKEESYMAVHYPNQKVVEFHLPEEDGEGYSKWRLWELMHKFGLYVGDGRPLPFEVNILVEVKGEE